MKHKIKKKETLIIVLAVLILFISFVPLSDILEKKSITGNVIAKAFITGLESVYECNIDLEVGWNLFSFPCKFPDTSVATVLSSVSGQFSSIHKYDAADTSDHWKVYNPDLPSWTVNDLSNMNEKDGYWIKMNSLSTFIKLGLLETPSTISLIKGWNLIGYPSINSKEVASALSTIPNDYSIILRYNATDDIYDYYDNSLDNGTLENMTEDYGYWINMTSDGLLIISW